LSSLTTIDVDRVQRDAGRQIRRAINHLVPYELAEEDNT
jgi:hypothetical protein